jgi:hypothetical protein
MRTDRLSSSYFHFPPKNDKDVAVESESFWAHWSNIEWLATALSSAGVFLAAFVWRLAIKVTLLEHRLRHNEESLEMRLDIVGKDTQRRHEENTHLQRGMQMKIDGLSHRIDRWFGGRNGV